MVGQECDACGKRILEPESAMRDGDLLFCDRICRRNHQKSVGHGLEGYRSWTAPPRDESASAPSGTEGSTGLAAALGPLQTIWLEPRSTIRRIVDPDPTYLVLPITALAGVIQMLNTASNLSWGDRFPLPLVLLLAAVLGPIGG